MAKKEAESFGGHDHEFIGEVADRYNCQICTKVIREPHLAVCCGQHFCESCLNKWFKRQGKESCPHCRAEGADGFHHVINKGLRSEINQLKIKCSNHGKGCGWTGELGQLKMHLESEKGCGFVIIDCPNRCQSDYTILRKELAVHLKSECILRPYQCKYCGHKDTFKGITGIVCSSRVMHMVDVNKSLSHHNKCPAYPLTCPNKCGARDIKRKDMADHRSKCPQEPVECPFAEAGCDDKIRRHELDSHVASSMQQHLLLVMGAYKQMKLKLQDTETKLITAVHLLTKGNELKEAAEATVCRPGMYMYLKQLNDSIVLIMSHIQEYHRNGKVWHSLPFYFREGYKMCLTVSVKHTSTSYTAITISICPLKGEHDDQLQWPVKCESSLPGLHYIQPHGANHTYFRACTLQQSQTEICQTHGEQACEMRNDLPNHIVNNSLIFNVVYMHCALKVCFM